MEEAYYFGFDVGEGSLGVAVRKGDDMQHAASYLLEPDHGRSSKSRSRRGQHRTRKSHLDREKFLRKLWKNIGKEPMEGEGVSPENKERLHREFAKTGDSEEYNSSVLRVMLYEKQPLKDWQIYKALRSAIQKRGYDDKVEWKKDSGSEDDGKENTEALEAFKKELKEEITNKQYHLPCYYNVSKMGLWEEASGLLPNTKEHREKMYLMGRAKPYVAPREKVEKELRGLLEAAKEQIPELKGHDTGEILYGPTKKPYKSAKEVKGILNQKRPRFNNRCVRECILLPQHYQVARPDLLSASVVFLKKLHDFRYNGADKKEARFTVEDLKEFLSEAEAKAKKEAAKLRAEGKEDKAKGLKPDDESTILKKLFKHFKLTKTQLGKIVEGKGGLLGVMQVIDAPKATGRTAYSRPALRFLKALYLSGQAPKEFCEQELAKTEKELADSSLTPKKRRTLEARQRDLKILHQRSMKGEKGGMGDSWENIHIAAVPFSEYIGKDNKGIKTQAQKILAECRNGVVRHRVEFLYKKYQDLINEFGKPKQVNVEFIRDDFMGKDSERRKKFIKMQEANRKENDLVRKERGGPTNFKQFRKHKLFRSQARICLYTGKALSRSKLDADEDEETHRCLYKGTKLYRDKLDSGDYQVDHIVPREDGGNDALYNVVLTTREANQEKGKRTPYEWLKSKGEWNAYVNRVNSAPHISKKKKAILTSENPKEFIEKYTGFAETAYIARLCRDVLYAHHGKSVGAEGQEKFVQVIDGSTTARVRGINGLNKHLRNKANDDTKNEKQKKDRSDKRHHALDAMVLTYAGEWMRNPKLLEKYKYKEYLNDAQKQSIVERLNQVIPKTVIGRKPAIGETFYGKRTIDGKEVIVSRKAFTADFAEKDKNLEGIIDKGLRESIKNRLQKYVIGALEKKDIYEGNDKWEEEFAKAFKEEFETGKGGRSIIKKVTCRASKSNPKEFKDVSITKKGTLKIHPRQKKPRRGQYVIDGDNGKFNKGKFIYRDSKGKVQVRSIHAFERIPVVKKDIEDMHDDPWIPEIGAAVIESGVTIFRLHKEFEDKRGNLPAGLYTLKKIDTKGSVYLFTPKGELRGSYAIGKLIDECGLEVYFPKSSNKD